MSLIRRGVARWQRMPPAPTPRDSAADSVLALSDTHRLVQPAAQTSGPAVLTMMRMCGDDAFCTSIATAPDPPAAFAAAAAATVQQTNAFRDRSGQLQLPWRGDTRPAALIRDLGRGWHNRVIDPGHREFAYDVIVTYSEAGWLIPLYVGDGSWMQHTVLVMGADADALRVYEPRHGTVVERDRDAFAAGRLDLGGWHEPWLFILPGERPGHRFA